MGSEGYDEWAKVVNFTEPFEIIRQVDKMAQDNLVSKDGEQLDIGAGTGVIGRELGKLGFSNLFALDATE